PDMRPVGSRGRDPCHRLRLRVFRSGAELADTRAQGMAAASVTIDRAGLPRGLASYPVGANGGAEYGCRFRIPLFPDQHHAVLALGGPTADMAIKHVRQNRFRRPLQRITVTTAALK